MCKARSLISPKFQALIASLNFEPDVIAINETWEKPYSTGQCKSLQGYVFISNPRLISKGGGVAMYIKRNITYQLYTELTVMNEMHFESIFVILKLDAVEVVCGTIYRSLIHMSSSVDIFLDSLNKSLAALKKTEKHKLHNG